MIDGDFYNDEPRPFFGEHSEPVGVLATHRRDTGERRGTYEDHYQWRIQDGVCPSCRTELREPGTDSAACDRCGWSVTEEKLRRKVERVEDRPDYLPRLPLALFVDEYAAANVEEDAA